MPYNAFEPERSAVLVLDLARDFVFPGGTIADAGGEDDQEDRERGLESFKTWYATDPDRSFRTVDELMEAWTEAAAEAVR